MEIDSFLVFSFNDIVYINIFETTGTSKRRRDQSINQSINISDIQSIILNSLLFSACSAALVLIWEKLHFSSDFVWEAQFFQYLWKKSAMMICWTVLWYISILFIFRSSADSVISPSFADIGRLRLVLGAGHCFSHEILEEDPAVRGVSSFDCQIQKDCIPYSVFWWFSLY